MTMTTTTAYILALFLPHLQPSCKQTIGLPLAPVPTDVVYGSCHHNDGGLFASIVEKISFLRSGLSTAEDLLQGITEALEQTALEVRVIR